MVDGDVNVPDGLGVVSVGVEGIVSHVDAVKVNISVEENVSPECIGKVWAVSLHDEVVFGMPDVNKVVRLEQEHLCDIHVKGS